MAAGFAYQNGVQATEDGRILLTFDVLLVGTDVPDGKTYYPSAVAISATDTALNIRSKCSQQIIADAATYGISLTTTNLTLPSWQKG